MKKLRVLILVLALMFSVNIFATESSNSISVTEENPVRIIDFEIEVEEPPVTPPVIPPTPIDPPKPPVVPPTPIDPPKPPVTPPTEPPVAPPTPVQPQIQEPEKPKEVLGTIKGYVLTDKREPIIQAKVLLNGSDRTTITDDKGYFEFTNVALGEHKIYLSDQNISPNLILLRSITVTDDTSSTHKIDGKTFITKVKEVGSVEAASVALTEEKNERTVEMIVELQGKIIVKYMSNNTLLDQVEMPDLTMGLHTVTAKEFEGYSLNDDNTKEVELTNQNAEVTVIFNYDLIPIPVEKKMPILPFILGGLFFFIILILLRKHIIVYSVKVEDGEEVLTRLSKKKVKFKKGDIIVDLTKELRLAEDEPLRVVFLKRISRRMGDRRVNFTRNKDVIYTTVAPTQLNKEYTVDIK